MTAYYSEEAVEKLEAGRRDARQQHFELQAQYFHWKFKNPKSIEFSHHGLCRRISTLVRAIDVVFETLPPELEDIPDRNRVVDATMAIQSFVMNTFGCLDNMAWMLVHERGVKAANGKELKPKAVSLESTRVRDACSKEFCDYVDSRDDWFRGMKDFRDSLAHRVPLYIPPFIVSKDRSDDFERFEKEKSAAFAAKDFDRWDQLDADQTKLGHFRPCMIHSFAENSPAIPFHVQLLADFATIHEFGCKVMNELGR